MSKTEVGIYSNQNCALEGHLHPPIMTTSVSSPTSVISPLLQLIQVGPNVALV